MYYYNADSSGEMSAFPAETPIGMCYVPFQKYGEVFPANTALEKATIFPELYLPFKGMGADEDDA